MALFSKNVILKNHNFIIQEINQYFHNRMLNYSKVNCSIWRMLVFQSVMSSEGFGGT